METGNIQSEHGVSLVGNGPLGSSDLVDSVARAPTLVAADGGASRCLSQGHSPEFVIGDLDSVTPETRTALPKTRFIEVAEQDTTDFEKCLTRIDAPFIVATGFTGGRLDHTLTVLSVLARRVGPPTVLLSPEDVIFAAPTCVSLSLDVGTRVSLFPMWPVRGTSSGLKWPIDGLVLAPDGQVGTSNQAQGPVHLSFDTAGCLVITPRETLESVLAAIC